jgi:hypothetical protein
MKGFYNEESKSSYVEKVIIASFKGDKEDPRFQIWNRDYKQGQELQENQEIRGGYCYDTFEKFEGIFEAINVVDETITYDGVSKVYKRLIVTMSVDQENIQFDIGTYTGRYAQNLLERMINPVLSLNKSVIIFPYRFTDKDTNKTMIGIGVWQGVNEKGEPIKIKGLRKEEKQAMGVPEPEMIETDQGVQWVWSKRARWMVEYVKNKLTDSFMEGDAIPTDSIKPDPIIEEQPSKGEIGGKLYNRNTPPQHITSEDVDLFSVEDDLPF